MCNNNTIKIEHNGETYDIVGKIEHYVSLLIFEHYAKNKILSIEDYILQEVETDTFKGLLVAVKGTDCRCHLGGFLHGLDEAFKVLEKNPELWSEIHSAIEMDESNN